MVSADQPRGAGVDPGGLRARSRRASGALPASQPLETKVDLEGFAAELIDRFGKLPREVNTLLLVVRIKAMCKRAHIARLDAGPKGATIQFHNDKFPNPKGLVEFVQAQQGLAKVKDNKIIVRRDWAREADKIKGAFAIARDLAQHAAA
jgi:transcription-repair coupling factor (superfamily II helicase)